MAHQGAVIITSVMGRVVEDLADSVRHAVGGRVDIRATIRETTWVLARRGGRISSLAIRLRGFLSPFLVALGPRKGQSVLIATTNPFLLPAAVALRRRRARLVTLVYDLYPESLDVRTRWPRPMKALIASITEFGLQRSAAVVFLGERTAEYVVSRYSLTCPTAVIPPGCAELPLLSVPPLQLKSLANDFEDKVVISYIGNMGSVHEAVTLAEAIRIVLASSGGRAVVVISARGDRAPDLIGPLADVPGVTVLGHLSTEEWAWLNRRTDIALTSLHARAGLVSLPSKIFTGLAGGSAILAVAPNESDLADLVRSHGVGVVTPPGDVNAAVRALQSLVDDTDVRSAYARAALAASSHFTPDRLGARWSALFALID